MQNSRVFSDKILSFHFLLAFESFQVGPFYEIILFFPQLHIPDVSHGAAFMLGTPFLPLSWLYLSPKQANTFSIRLRTFSPGAKYLFMRRRAHLGDVDGLSFPREKNSAFVDYSLCYALSVA